MNGRQGENDESITLRAPRPLVAFVLALAVHAIAVALFTLLPAPKPKPERIAITLTRRSPPPPPPPSSTAPSPVPPVKQRPPKQQPPRTSPVVPELAPSEAPPENRAQLPVAEKDPTPAPPPAPEETWGEKLLESLKTPPPKVATGVLAPSLATLDRVAFNDARMHDDENERRLQEDHGAFFRRGIEALRGQWHPDRVLRTRDPRDATKLCGKSTRTTHAVAVIDRKGNVVDVDMKKPSGCPQLDEEAVAAFLRVAHFPNPPSGLFINPDRTPAATARYPVRFIVSFDGGLRIEWR